MKIDKTFIGEMIGTGLCNLKKKLSEINYWPIIYPKITAP